MLTISGSKHSLCDGISRRSFLRAGVLGLGGLTLADLLRLRASGGVRQGTAHKAVIMIYLPGGPSHIDMYDMKPDAAAEFRGEFKPIQTNVTGMHICELMPLQARIADKFAIVQGLRTKGNHDTYELISGIAPPATGVLGKVRRPVFGSVVSKLRGANDQAIPPYVSMGDHALLTGYDDAEDPAYLGPAHKPFRATGEGRDNLTLHPDITLDRLQDRKALVGSFDQLQRDIGDPQGTLAGVDGHTARALEMLSSTRVRDAFDTSQEPDRVREKYGPHMEDLLMARRLVEAGVSVVTVPLRVTVPYAKAKNRRKVLDAWDTHACNFVALRMKLPFLDRGLYALLTDLHERGLANDVAVVMWGEFGREPKIYLPTDAEVQRSGLSEPGRGHWPEAGFVFLAGGGLKTGQVVNKTDHIGARLANGHPYTSQNVLATLYHVLGIDTNQTFPDNSGRPQHLLDDQEKIAPLF
jgi:hypothetical protein